MSRINSYPTILATRLGRNKPDTEYVRLITGPVTVDDENWYQVNAGADVVQWIKTQDKNQWAEVIDERWYTYKSVIDVHERIYTLLLLKYSFE